jgi:hypothetical protein
MSPPALLSHCEPLPLCLLSCGIIVSQYFGILDTIWLQYKSPNLKVWKILISTTNLLKYLVFPVLKPLPLKYSCILLASYMVYYPFQESFSHTIKLFLPFSGSHHQVGSIKTYSPVGLTCQLLACFMELALEFMLVQLHHILTKQFSGLSDVHSGHSYAESLHL